MITHPPRKVESLKCVRAFHISLVQTWLENCEVSSLSLNHCMPIDSSYFDPVPFVLPRSLRVLQCHDRFVDIGFAEEGVVIEEMRLSFPLAAFLDCLPKIAVWFSRITRSLSIVFARSFKRVRGQLPKEALCAGLRTVASPFPRITKLHIHLLHWCDTETLLQLRRLFPCLEILILQSATQGKNA